MTRAPRFTEREVRDAVAQSRSIAQALRNLGLRAAGGNFRSFKRIVAYYRISTEHFDPKWSLPVNLRKSLTPLHEILIEGSTYSRSSLKRRLYEAGWKQRRCELCGQNEHWQGRTMALILDHINGVATDNRLENLRIVCPNCAATLDTHCGRKNRIEREPRSCLHCGTRFIPKYGAHRYCSQACGIHSKGPREPKPKTRKVERPSYEQLMDDVSSMSLLAIGRKYGVSDNAVRKWIRWYEAQAAGSETHGRAQAAGSEEPSRVQAGAREGAGGSPTISA